MNKKAIILDLDNTVYPVASIAHKLFEPLLLLIRINGEYQSSFESIKKDLMRKPVQKVAKEHGFSERLTAKVIEHLKDMSYEDKISPFEDYAIIKKISCKKFLVTTGFTKLQQSKILRLGISKDFEEIHIADPLLSPKTKKDIFRDIMMRHEYEPSHLLVIGDDPESEIQAANELGIESVLYDKINFNPRYPLSRITDYEQLIKFCYH